MLQECIYPAHTHTQVQMILLEKFFTLHLAELYHFFLSVVLCAVQIHRVFVCVRFALRATSVLLWGKSPDAVAVFNGKRVATKV